MKIFEKWYKSFLTNISKLTSEQIEQLKPVDGMMLPDGDNVKVCHNKEWHNIKELDGLTNKLNDEKVMRLFQNFIIKMLREQKDLYNLRMEEFKKKNNLHALCFRELFNVNQIMTECLFDMFHKNIFEALLKEPCSEDFCIILKNYLKENYLRLIDSIYNIEDIKDNG